MMFIGYEAGKKYIRSLDASDLPPEAMQGLVGQWHGHSPIPIGAGSAKVRVNHTETEIIVPSVLGSVALSPGFLVTPAVEGFYLVHHERYERIYGPVGGYDVELLVESTETLEVDNMTPELGGAVSGPLFDVVKLKRTRLVYCNGSTDQIKISLRHSYTSSLTFGSSTGLNSRATTTIIFAGLHPTHGELP